MAKSNRLTLYIFIALFAGVLAGLAVYSKATPAFAAGFADKIKLLTTIFLHLIQMLIAPLVFCTLVAGIAKMGDLTTVGRVGGKAMLIFISASFISLFLGMVLVNLFNPGGGFHDVAANTTAIKDIEGTTQAFTINNFIEHVFPKSIVSAMAENQILQIVVFSIFFGVATAAIGEKGKIVIRAMEAVSLVILKMVGYVMNFAPVGVFGAIASVIAVNGLGKILVFYGKYLLFFAVGVALLWVILLVIAYLILRGRLIGLLRAVVQPVFIAFGTTSSEAVFPKLTEELERFGCQDKIVAFTLPLAYSFNLVGSMIYMTFASVAIAQAYNINLDFGTQLTMLLVLMLTSKGMAGVPRAALVVVLATCGMFGIPAAGVALILPIDHFCDMLRTSTNVLGNALATAVVSKWEKALGPETIL